MGDMKRLASQSGATAIPKRLVLYKFDSCPYCRAVMRTIDDLRIDVVYRDTRRDPEARRELTQIGGKSQVPCLIIDGVPLYESRDIIAFLQKLRRDTR